MASGDIMDVLVPNKWSVPQEGWDFTGVFDWWPNPLRKNAELTGGFAGHGMIWEDAWPLWQAAVFALVWFLARTLSKKVIFPPMARVLGVKGKKKQAKFSYNMWLLLFYGSSSLFGWFYVLPGEPYFTFPVDKHSGATMWTNHPFPIAEKIHWYYVYQLGFYIAELYAIFVEPKRSDFIEYVIHHIVTIVLIGVSYIAHEHRVGAMIIFIHDVPDVILCFTKLFLYTGLDNLSSATFALFAATFGYLRLYCFPLITYTIFCLAPQFHPATTAYWFLAVLLGVVLQSLQIFWFAMIMKIILGIVIRFGKHDGADPRSDDDDDEEEGQSKKGAAKKGGKKHK
uniref:TLC domain-containing protein n=1 Tax=Neobodo designis TaxID=312471 RepID=A0A7S1R4D1_NEODS